jgi:signal transduction histidine kinase
VPLSEAFLEQSAACHWLVNSEGLFHAVYGDSAGLFGRPASDLTGRPVAQAFDPEDVPLWRDRFARVFEGERLTLRERRRGSTWYIALFPVNNRTESYVGGSAREGTPWNTADQELRNTVLGALKAQEFERAMASKFLHDVVGQNLTALGLQLDLIRMDLESLSPESCSRISEIQKLLETIMEEVRDYSYELNPSTVQRAGLRSAMDRLIVRLRERFTGAIRSNVDPSLKLDPKIASGMYQIAQEAVENSVQHASCSVIEIAVKSTRAGAVLEIRDNGKGFDPADTPGSCRGLGLLSMEHYAAEAGLDLSISSCKETGTCVRAAALEGA